MSAGPAFGHRCRREQPYCLGLCWPCTCPSCCMTGNTFQPVPNRRLHCTLEEPRAAVLLRLVLGKHLPLLLHGRKHVSACP